MTKSSVKRKPAPLRPQQPAVDGPLRQRPPQKSFGLLILSALLLTGWVLFLAGMAVID